MKNVVRFLLLWGATVLLYNIIFALNWGMVACNEGGVGQTVTFGIHSCVWNLSFFVLEIVFLIAAVVAFFRVGPSAFFRELWEKRGKVVLFLLAVAVVVGAILLAVIAIKHSQHPEQYPGPWYNIL